MMLKSRTENAKESIHNLKQGYENRRKAIKSTQGWLNAIITKK